MGDLLNAFQVVLVDLALTSGLQAADGAQHPLGLGGYLDIGILDTMKDLFVNFIGAVVFSFIGYFYVKNRGKGWFAKRFIPKVLPESGAKK